VTSATFSVTIQGGPEGFVYVPLGSPGFTVPMMLVSEYQGDVVSAFEIDANGDPKPATRAVFVEALDGAEGAAIDPLTGDFLFSTFGGGNQVWAVRGFATPDSTSTTTTTTSSTTMATASSTTMTTTSSTTTTTTLAACNAGLPLADLAGLECAIAAMQTTLGQPPLPECTGTGRCTCKSRDALTKMAATLATAQAAPTPKKCKRKLADVRRMADVLRRHVNQQAKRNCLAAGERRETLVAEAAAIRERARAVQKSGYCTAR
jgi:hypothetical protein